MDVVTLGEVILRDHGIEERSCKGICFAQVEEVGVEIELVVALGQDRDLIDLLSFSRLNDEIFTFFAKDQSGNAVLPLFVIHIFKAFQVSESSPGNLDHDHAYQARSNEITEQIQAYHRQVVAKLLLGDGGVRIESFTESEQQNDAKMESKDFLIHRHAFSLNRAAQAEEGHGKYDHVSESK